MTTIETITKKIRVTESTHSIQDLIENDKYELISVTEIYFDTDTYTRVIFLQKKHIVDFYHED